MADLEETDSGLPSTPNQNSYDFENDAFSDSDTDTDYEFNSDSDSPEPREFVIETSKDNGILVVDATVLAAKSYVLASTLYSNPNINRLRIDHINFEAMTLVMDNIYYDRFPKPKTENWKIWADSALEITTIATKLGLWDLKAFCDSNLAKICNFYNIFEWRNFAQRNKLNVALKEISDLLTGMIAASMTAPSKRVLSF